MKEIWTALSVVFLFFSLVGCSDYREINDTAMVAGIGIDRGTRGKYAVSVEIIQPASGESAKPTANVLTDEGDNVEDCLKRLVYVATKELQFSHCKLILFSDDLTEEGIGLLIDAFLRDPRYRSDLFLAVVEGKKASEMLSVGKTEERIASFDYASVIENSYRETGSVPPARLYQFFMDGNYTLLPFFNESEGQYSVGGTFGFYDGKKCGRLDLSSTQSIMLVSGEFPRGELLLVDKVGCGIPCQIRSVETKRKITDGDSLSVTAEIQCNIRLTSLPQGLDLSTQDGVSAAEAEISRLMSEKLRNDWEVSVENHMEDLFGLSVYVYRHAPRLFELWEKGEKGTVIELIPQCRVTLENFGFSDERIGK